VVLDHGDRWTAAHIDPHRRLSWRSAEEPYEQQQSRDLGYALHDIHLWQVQSKSQATGGACSALSLREYQKQLRLQEARQLKRKQLSQEADKFEQLVRAIQLMFWKPLPVVQPDRLARLVLTSSARKVVGSRAARSARLTINKHWLIRYV
jgi:hypothetical protein